MHFLDTPSCSIYIPLSTDPAFRVNSAAATCANGATTQADNRRSIASSTEGRLSEWPRSQAMKGCRPGRVPSSALLLMRSIMPHVSGTQTAWQPKSIHTLACSSWLAAPRGIYLCDTVNASISTPRPHSNVPIRTHMSYQSFLKGMRVSTIRNSLFLSHTRTVLSNSVPLVHMNMGVQSAWELVPHTNVVKTTGDDLPLAASIAGA